MENCREEDCFIDSFSQFYSQQYLIIIDTNRFQSFQIQDRGVLRDRDSPCSNYNHSRPGVMQEKDWGRIEDLIGQTLKYLPGKPFASWYGRGCVSLTEVKQ